MTSPVLAVAARTLAETGTPGGIIDLKTGLLIAVTVCLVVVASRLLKMNRRIVALETASPFPQTSAPGSAPTESIPAHTVAAISAAVHTTLNGRHRILSIGEPCPKRQAWSVEGRRQVFQSHNVR